MVNREVCPHCKGNRYVRVQTSDGKSSHIKCPHCAGQGYKIRLVR